MLPNRSSNRSSRFQRKPAAEPPPKAVSTLAVPDALLEWGRDPSRVVGWSRDWAQEVAELAAASAVAPLTESATQRFLARLEALVAEAVAAGRSDLLVGLDIQTAEWLGLKYSATVNGRSVEFGKGGDFEWSEVRVLTVAYQDAVEAKRLQVESDVQTEDASVESEEPDPEKLGPSALNAMDLVRGVFPSAKVAAAHPTQPLACCACGDTSGSARVEADLGSLYCWTCWSQKTGAYVLSAPLKGRVPSNRGRS